MKETEEHIKFWIARDINELYKLWKQIETEETSLDDEIEILLNCANRLHCYLIKWRDEYE